MKTPYKKNKLIADFMGLKTFDRSNGISGLWCAGNDGDEFVSYDSSWDWLMPVVEKIEKTNRKVEISGYVCFIYPNETLENYDEYNYEVTTVYSTKIEATYVAVIKFIKWYNKQNKV